MSPTKPNRPPPRPPRRRPPPRPARRQPLESEPAAGGRLQESPSTRERIAVSSRPFHPYGASTNSSGDHSGDINSIRSRRDGQVALVSRAFNPQRHRRGLASRVEPSINEDESRVSLRSGSSIQSSGQEADRHPLARFDGSIPPSSTLNDPGHVSSGEDRGVSGYSQQNTLVGIPAAQQQHQQEQQRGRARHREASYNNTGGQPDAPVFGTSHSKWVPQLGHRIREDDERNIDTIRPGLNRMGLPMAPVDTIRSELNRMGLPMVPVDSPIVSTESDRHGYLGPHDHAIAEPLPARNRARATTSRPDVIIQPPEFVDEVEPSPTLRLAPPVPSSFASPSVLQLATATQTTVTPLCKHTPGGRIDAAQRLFGRPEILNGIGGVSDRSQDIVGDETLFGIPGRENDVWALHKETYVGVERDVGERDVNKGEKDKGKGRAYPREVLLETESIKTERAATPVFPGAFQFQRDDDGFLGDS